VIDGYSRILGIQYRSKGLYLYRRRRIFSGVLGVWCFASIFECAVVAVLVVYLYTIRSRLTLRSIPIDLVNISSW
jgi:uncharacterized membrane protein